MIWVLVVVASLVVLIYLAGYIFSAPGYEGATSDHYNGSTFENLGKVKSKGFSDVIKWYFNRDQGEWKEIDNFEYGEKPPAKVHGSTIRVTFVNHATFLIQTQGINILTDPVWSERTSPLDFIGPRRYVPAGIKFEDLPDIDIVIISHNHYDHLDVSTIKRLVKDYNPAFFVPLGISSFLTKTGVENTVDMDWWEERQLSPELTLACVPAQHFSGRGTFDRDKTLWTGFVVKGSGGNIYFAGDTGYGDFFKTIGEKYGPFKLSFLPIGAYKPEWFMSPIHTSPEEAVKAHRDVHSQQSIAMHFGTFPLADDGMEAPVEDLKRAMEKYKVGMADFLILKNGESVEVK